MSSQHRVRRVADLIQRELSDILHTELEDPRVELATVSGVEVSKDLSVARVRFSLLGDDEGVRAESMAALERAKGFIRRQLAPRLGLRMVPELRFVLDRGAEHSLRIHELLASLPETSPSEDPDDGADPDDESPAGDPSR